MFNITQNQQNIGYGRAFWGPRLWYILHKMSYTYPDRASTEQQQLYYQFFNLTRYMIPCPFCSIHYKDAIQNKMLERQLNTRQEVIDWFRNHHNDVNISKSSRIYHGFELDRLYNGPEFNHYLFYELLDYLYRMVVRREIDRTYFINWVSLTYQLHPCQHCRITSEQYFKKNSPLLLKFNDNNVLSNWIDGIKIAAGYQPNVRNL